MIDFEKVIEGWRNHLFPPEKLKEIIKRVSDERLAICNECEFHSKFHKSLRPDDHCMDCGCSFPAKQKCLSCSCELPIPKWTAVVSREEEREINFEDNENS